MPRFLKQNFIVYFFAFLIVFGIPYNLSQNRWYDNTWTIGEWMISYAGGFVRRGLPGSLIFNFSTAFRLNPVHVIWFLSVSSYMLLAFLLWKFCSGKFKAAFLLSPIILLSPVIGSDTFVRKDTMILALYGACLLAIQCWHSKRMSNMVAFSLLNLLACFAIFSHETFGFWGLPSIIMLTSFMLSGNSFSGFKEIGKACIFLSPSLLAFVVCMSARGSLTQAIKIHQSWQTFTHVISSYGAMSASEPIPGAVRALSWTLNDTLGFIRTGINDFSHFVWIPAVWMLTIYICMNLFVWESGDQVLSSLKRNIVLFQFLASGPLFIIAHDYGRWIFFWITSSALLCGLIYNIIAATGLRPPRIATDLIVKNIVPGLPLVGSKIYLLLFLAVPIGNWSIERYWISTPVFFFSRVLSKSFSLLHA